MDIKKVTDTLHPLERKVIPYLKNNESLKAIQEKSQLKYAEVARALQWLENKFIIKTEVKAYDQLSIDKNGIYYEKRGLPERHLLNQLKEKKLSFEELTKNSHLHPNEVQIGIGHLKNRAALTFIKDKTLYLTLSEQGVKLLSKELPEEKLLKKLAKHPIKINELDDEEKFAFHNLKNRKLFVKVNTIKDRIIFLTELGNKIIEQKLENKQMIEIISPQIIREKKWKNTPIRRYDIKINVPKLYPGKKQLYRNYLDSVRNKFIALGFNEMFGSIVETDFWDMDSLFMPQFHSARDIHDAYYIKDPKYSEEIPKPLLERVKQAHENGYTTGSKGWNYEFDVKRTTRYLLRTQGTALSARTLASKELEIPGKYFAIARCFRPDVIDATHLADFIQIEGIVVDENLNLRHLIGLLKLFAKEFAETDQIKIVPAYFPFTEPSLSLYAKHPKMGWIELGGSGIFRPEVTIPLGVKVPVLAWGLGIDRLAMFKLNLKDIRQLFSHDLGFLRNEKVI